jgi:hypothetical protein
VAAAFMRGIFAILMGISLTRSAWVKARMFFFEKKNQKTFIRLEPRRSDWRGSKVQKFFASFFQKRSPFFA